MLIWPASRPQEATGTDDQRTVGQSLEMPLPNRFDSRGASRHNSAPLSTSEQAGISHFMRLQPSCSAKPATGGSPMRRYNFLRLAKFGTLLVLMLLWAASA